VLHMARAGHCRRAGKEGVNIIAFDIAQTLQYPVTRSVQQKN
jgi:hypothetical protein